MKNKKRGFSLIEVVVALAVISVGVLPILSMYPSALKMTTKATTNEEWSRVTMSILDYVKAKGYDSLKSEFFSSGSAIFEENYEFEPDAPGSKRYKSKNNKFEDDFFGGTNLFFINTKLSVQLVTSYCDLLSGFIIVSIILVNSSKSFPLS